MDKLTNAQIIAKVKDYQTYPFVHPLTCGNNSLHRELEAREVKGKVVLVCLDCDYVQTWIPEVIFSMDFTVWPHLD